MKTLTLTRRVVAGFGVCAIALAAAAQTPAPTTGKSLAASAGVIAYPAKGQKPEQQTKDEAECYNWSKQQSGYDPLAPPAAKPAQAAGPTADGSRVRGAARGAAAGAIVGEVADNDADKGAAIGATAGALAGGRRSRMAQSQKQQQAQQQAGAAQQELVNAFKRGMSVCLEARGYTVK
jgi:hypothetical protein